MRLLGKHIFPRQIVLFFSGLLVLVATTYDVHRSIKNNEKPPSKEQLQALQDYLHSKRHPSTPSPPPTPPPPPSPPPTLIKEN